MHRRHAFAIAATCAGVLVGACSSNGSTAPATLPTPSTAPTTLIPQTTVALSTTTTVAELPARPGAITVQVPPVDVVHLHHGVWLNTAAKDRTSPLPERFFAAGEEKTAVALPAPYGYHYTTTDHWVLNYMLHNLTNEDKQVWVTYDIDIIPDAAPQSAGIISTHPVWMDVQNGSTYPVFDAVRGAGDGVTYTYPDQASNPYGGGAKKNEWTVDRDGVLVYTAGHLHPGGLRTDLFANRGTTSAHLFESEAKYYEPAGAVSWDVAMTATLPTWHVAVHKGDVLSTTATYDSGELGTGGPPTANRTTWTIPADLPAGTYTYFCRIHPLMRGAFRVEP